MQVNPGNEWLHFWPTIERKQVYAYAIGVYGSVDSLSSRNIASSCCPLLAKMARFFLREAKLAGDRRL